jgi:hypothetical protein
MSLWLVEPNPTPSYRSNTGSVCLTPADRNILMPPVIQAACTVWATGTSALRAPEVVTQKIAPDANSTALSKQDHSMACVRYQRGDPSER